MQSPGSLLANALRSRGSGVVCVHQLKNTQCTQSWTVPVKKCSELRLKRTHSRCSLVEARRSFYTSSPARREAEQQRQAMPLGDFYTDLLSSPLPNKSSSEPHLPTFVQSGDKTKEERAKLLFGSIEGSGYERHTYDKPDATWRTINGVPVPPRPSEPDNCCMSGCVHCVWDDYRDDVESWAARVAEAQARSLKKRARGGTPKIDMARPEVNHASGSMDDDGGGSESLWTSPSRSVDPDEELFQSIPVGIREFMATEKRIRDRRRGKREKSTPADDDFP